VLFKILILGFIKMEAPKNKNEIINLFKQGPSMLENTLSRLSENELDYAPSNGGWSIRQIIHHIADGDDLWKTGIKVALGSEHAKFSLKWYQTIPQIEWAKRWKYEKRSIATSLNLFKVNRDHILQLLEYVPDGWTKTFQYQEPDGKIELIPIGFVIEMQAKHVVHHINRILEIRKEISSA
jgi:hypothetical protein